MWVCGREGGEVSVTCVWVGGRGMVRLLVTVWASNDIGGLRLVLYLWTGGKGGW